MTLTLRKASGWTISWLLVLAVHIGIGLWALYWHAQAMPVEMPPPAMLIELPPMPEVVTPPPAPAQIVEPEPEPVPEVVEAPKPKLVLEKPKPKPKPKVKPVEPPKPVEKPAEEPQENMQPAPPSPPTPQPPQSAPVSPGRPGSQADEKANWLGKVKAHMDPKMHYPASERRGRTGTAYNLVVTFTVDSKGKILDASISQSSARAAFNNDVLRQIRRTSPVPVPPEEVMVGGQVLVNYPLNFNLQGASN